MSSPEQPTIVLRAWPPHYPNGPIETKRWDCGCYRYVYERSGNVVYMGRPYSDECLEGHDFDGDE